MIRAYKKGVPIKFGYFNLSEFQCHCNRPDCNVIYIDDALIEALNRKRANWNKPIIIISGFRCTAHNEAVNGKAGSRHLIGKAADIRVEGMTPATVADCCEDMGGLGRGKTFCHIDTRTKKTRWTY